MKHLLLESRSSRAHNKFVFGTILGLLTAGLIATAEDRSGSTNALSPSNAPTSRVTDSLAEKELPQTAATNVSETTVTNLSVQAREIETQLNFARGQRLAKDTALATKMLVRILEGEAPAEFKRLALFELALVSQDAGEFVKAQQTFSQYLQRYPDDPSIPDVLLRQGLLYRQMGVTELAISKFYAVMSSALRLKLDDMEYYKKLVVQAQIEIANSYYLEGKYAESADFFKRLARSEPNDAQIQFKLIRSLSYLPNHADTIARAQVFLETHPASLDLPEVRFLLASALKSLGRNQDSMKQVLLLLQSQEENVQKNPEAWIYWQQRAGNGIANQLYKEGDYFSALQIYLALAELDKSPAWQVPVWYQIGLVYEQLQQPQKAIDTYLQVMDRQKELSSTNASPGLVSLFDMAKWRKDYVAWMEKARITNKTFQPRDANEQASATAP